MPWWQARFDGLTHGSTDEAPGVGCIFATASRHTGAIARALLTVASRCRPALRVAKHLFQPSGVSPLPMDAWLQPQLVCSRNRNWLAATVTGSRDRVTGRNRNWPSRNRRRLHHRAAGTLAATFIGSVHHSHRLHFRLHRSHQLSASPQPPPSLPASPYNWLHFRLHRWPPPSLPASLPLAAATGAGLAAGSTLARAASARQCAGSSVFAATGFSRAGRCAGFFSSPSFFTRRRLGHRRRLFIFRLHHLDSGLRRMSLARIVLAFARRRFTWLDRNDRRRHKRLFGPSAGRTAACEPPALSRRVAGSVVATVGLRVAFTRYVPARFRPASTSAITSPPPSAGTADAAADSAEAARNHRIGAPRVGRFPPSQRRPLGVDRVLGQL